MYENSLIAMEYFLKEVNEIHWLKWIQKDIEEWITERSTVHHLSAYGGMGSFNDVVICGANNHSIPEGAEAWADVIFNWLKALCYFFAKNPEIEYSLSDLKEQIGYHDASLSAFVNGENAPDEMRGIFDNRSPIQGWRCLNCGYAEVCDSGINRYIAQNIVPAYLFEACVSNRLVSTVRGLLYLNISNLDHLISNAKQSIDESGILIRNREEWMRPCPSCGSNNTAIYRWRFSGKRLVADKDNLPLESKKGP
ncbi:DUF6966 domain-containing protein [Alterisphingorhabdus coralli]|uniref:DUF6966 domain-containing protein n=1 Tax=Alterisphingorhabdus coralli TaxID=3071408 RepID=A0AA97F5I0_9SPHN|nr:hypothetical protein [Parasphingorhabdus sp. SCSIO 66989]WOE74694.1 hypothetical protein RB602_12685 [Parasphingorhabdus sp. SCSIO 66989]